MHDTCLHPPTNLENMSVLKRHFLQLVWIGGISSDFALMDQACRCPERAIREAVCAKEKVSLFNLYTLWQPGSHFTSARPAYEGIFLHCIISNPTFSFFFLIHI